MTRRKDPVWAGDDSWPGQWPGREDATRPLPAVGVFSPPPPWQPASPRPGMVAIMAEAPETLGDAQMVYAQLYVLASPRLDVRVKDTLSALIVHASELCREGRGHLIDTARDERFCDRQFRPRTEVGRVIKSQLKVLAPSVYTGESVTAPGDGPLTPI